MNKVTDKDGNKKKKSLRPLSYDDIAFVRGGSGSGCKKVYRKRKSSSFFYWR